MPTATIQAIRECAQGSLDGTLRFPEVVERLGALGVSHYHVDFLRAEKTVYLENGESHVVPVPMPNGMIAPSFTAPEIIAAIRASQQHGLPYREFLIRARQAGCIGYVVYLEGRRVVYSGRTGDEHVEYFPPAP